MSERVAGCDGPARVTVLVRAHCPTCDRMADVVRRVCAQSGDSWAAVDIDAPGTDPETRAEYTDRIPVTLVDGAEHASWTVDPDALRRALAG